MFSFQAKQLTSIYDSLMDSVPDYSRFFTVDELYNHSRTVALNHTSFVQYQNIGYSQNGEAIPMLTMGNGSKSLLLYACPHPNEPIGSLLIDFLLNALIDYPQLLLTYTWHLIPCVDPDGTRLNEGWFSGPFTIRNYARNFYRPRTEEQVEWTFPITYKNYSWTTPSNETQALMYAIRLIQPDFVYGLHNSGFGGMYYYISQPLFDIFPQLERLPSSLGLFLAKGEAEAPWVIRYESAIFSPLSLPSAYDYYEKYTHSDPVTMMSGGGTSFDYLEEIGLNKTIFLMAELPYFQSPMVKNDTIIPNVTRRDVLLQGLDKDNESNAILMDLLTQIKPAMTFNSSFYRASRSLLELYNTTAASRRQAVLNDNSTLVPATVASQADALYISVFYKMLIASMLDRAIIWQMEQPSADRKLLENARIELESHLDDWINDIEQNLPYTPIRIRNLVQAQLGAMLIVLQKVGR
ncbi:unnamed protein product [Rotaria sordida]|uniref:Peptidase M14 domain-containing protein n=1 Tax=Rotaria sordida TaxID=392033 RepID=A0A815BE37_9BILA|nr:unnamed protein product [Rotaria sordida]CAF1340501.1 unnamed protein product [Rotaria sordida]CAF1352990.1 unnamed protein product [Rotaria sordida]CAF4069950.1 unnamed protein product [Rotaria sordida]CAF4126679.1 unnamed protein product [Rotaria sordida]